MIQFNIGEAWAIILSICGGIVTIAAVVSIVIRIVMFLRRPELKQNNRLDSLTERVDKIEAQNEMFMGYFRNDKERIELLERGNQVIQQALLALLAHGIDGNDVKSLKEAKSELEKFLIKRI